ncbi:hypothetical protein AGDE_04803 [Angomonas deanei]|nr:hypothetical protein AGDE_04803 [Angomonas deanei]|eukprot:EPY39126.1 hypothetical protein AGDE_04803 [Angomonas deanei]
MVVLVVKGSKYPDQFLFECKLSDAVNDTEDEKGERVEGVCRAVARVQNNRHQVRLMLLSAQELLNEINSGHYTPIGEQKEELIKEYATLTEQLYERLKDNQYMQQSVGEWEEAAATIRAKTTTLYSEWCTHKDGEEAAITNLYNQLENPDLPEDTRLRVYHCRAILDPTWKAEECGATETAALWFCGKKLEGLIGDAAGRNEKSKLIVKVAPKDGPAPSGEPRMTYEHQRELYQRIREKKETLRSLEESELRDRVVHQYRNRNMVLPSAVSSKGVPDHLNTSNLRPIHNNKTETVKE